MKKKKNSETTPELVEKAEVGGNNSEALKAKIAWKHGGRTHFPPSNDQKKKKKIFQLRFSTKMFIHV